MITTPSRHPLALTSALLAACLMLSACDNEVKGAKATVEEPTEEVVAQELEEAPAAAAVEEEEALGVTTLEVDKSASKIAFVGAKLTGKHDGGFKEFDGKLELNPSGDLTGVMFTVDVDSVYTDNDMLTGHLKQGDFFEVATYPEATFQSTEVRPGSDQKAEDGTPYTHTVVGNMTMRGVTKKLTFPVLVDTTGEHVVASTDFVVDRNDFKITYPGKPDDLIKPEVKISIALQAPKKS